MGIQLSQPSLGTRRQQKKCKILRHEMKSAAATHCCCRCCRRRGQNNPKKMRKKITRRSKQRRPRPPCRSLEVHEPHLSGDFSQDALHQQGVYLDDMYRMARRTANGKQQTEKRVKKRGKTGKSGGKTERGSISPNKMKHPPVVMRRSWS